MDYKKFYNQLMNKDFKPKPNTFFTSGEYKNYSEVQVGAVVSTAVDYIRNVLHFDIPQYEIMRRSSVPVFVQYNENGNTAYTDGSKIVMNAANDLVANYKSIYMQHASLQGMLRHETAHILFTDTSVIAKWCKALVYGHMLHQPDNVNTPDGKEIIKRLADDPVFAGVYANLAKRIENSVEDGYIEAELDTINDGMGDTIRYLATTNAAMIEQLMDADGFNYEKYNSKFNAVATFILVYAKFGYEFTNVPEDMVPFFDTLKGIIKECISSRVPTTRIANINKLMIAMYPVLKEQIENVSDAINDQMQSSGPSGENNDSEGQRGEGSGSGSDGSDESDESGSSDSQSKSGKGKQGNGAGGSMSGSDTILIRSDKKTDENNESGSDEDSGKKGETSSEKNDSASQDASDSSTGKSGSDKKDTSDGSNSSSKGNRTDSSDKGSGSDSKNADGTSETDAKPNGSKSDEGKSDKDTKAEGGKDGKNTSAEPKKMTAKEAEKIKKEIDDISQKVPSSDNNDCTDSSCKTSSIFNSNNVGADAKNNAGENVRQQSKQEVGKNPQDKEIRNIPGGSGLPEKSAYDDVTSIVSDMQRTAAEAKTEKQREKDLREEAAELTDKYKNMLAQQKCPDIGYFNQKARFLDGIGSISITRVVTPPIGAESVYQAVAGVVKSVSRPTQREIIKAIKDKRNGYKLTGLTMGRRVEASLIHHNDGKCFSKSKSPEDVPELCVGVLLDQSESTMGEIINYERLLALTIEDMCRSIEIPAIINGYSGGGGTVRIISYVEPNSVDRKNALRLTSMRADGGTPTAEALAYMLNRLEKRPEPSKILFVVTDGNSNNKAYLPMLLTEAKRNHIMVIAAGIGACRQSIHSEFPENFLDISDMNSMPRNICNIIKRKLVK